MQYSDSLLIEIGERLISLRKEYKLGQDYVEGILQQVISKYEKGSNKKLDPQLILFWADKGISLNWLITGKGSKLSESEGEVERLSKINAALKYALSKSI